MGCQERPAGEQVHDLTDWSPTEVLARWLCGMKRGIDQK